MFLANKYTHWYMAIIEKAKHRKFEEPTYTEKHHIIPRSMGGSNAKDNLVRLTAKEHIIVHLLLIKMVEGDMRRRMGFAYIRMMSGRQGQLSGLSRKEQLLFSREIGRLHSIALTGRKHSDETKEKMRQNSARRGQPCPQHVKEAISKANTGRMLGVERDQEFCQKVSRGLKGHKKSAEWVDKINRNPEKIAKMAAKHRGMKRSPEARQKMSLAKKGKFVPWNKGLNKQEQLKYSQMKDSESSQE